MQSCSYILCALDRFHSIYEFTNLWQLCEQNTFKSVKVCGVFKWVSQKFLHSSKYFFRSCKIFLPYCTVFPRKTLVFFISLLFLMIFSKYLYFVFCMICQRHWLQQSYFLWPLDFFQIFGFWKHFYVYFLFIGVILHNKRFVMICNWFWVIWQKKYDPKFFFHHGEKNFIDILSMKFFSPRWNFFVWRNFFSPVKFEVKNFSPRNLVHTSVFPYKI